MRGKHGVTINILILTIAVTLLACALAIRDRSISIASVYEENERLNTYRKIRQVLGIHMLAFYPSLVTSDLRMRLIKQLNAYENIDDDESEKRWERLWLPDLLSVSDMLSESDIAKQDTEFSETIEGFQTNERLITDAKAKRDALVRRPTVSIWRNERGVMDSHQGHDDDKATD